MYAYDSQSVHFLSSKNQSSRNDGISGTAKDTDGTEKVFARSFKTVEESTDLVGRHEGLSQLFVIPEINTPGGKSLIVDAALWFRYCVYEKESTYFA